jgi:hypothetical protein
MSYQYNVQIINNVLHYHGGDARITGTVSPSGEVFVHVSSGDGNASGSGHLGGSSGRGRFHGNSSSGVCNGSWTAERTGG